MELLNSEELKNVQGGAFACSKSGDIIKSSCGQSGDVTVKLCATIESWCIEGFTGSSCNGSGVSINCGTYKVCGLKDTTL